MFSKLPAIADGFYEMVKSIAYVLFRDPKQVIYLPYWLYSQLSLVPVERRNPMMPFIAVKWLETFLKPDMAVFEYGSGASTVFFASRVKK